MGYKFFYPPSVEADRRLLPYKNYDEYLDSHVKIVDLRNLRSTLVARIVAGLGYRSTGETLSEQEFYKHRSVIQEAFRPTIRPYECDSKGLTPTEPLAMALAQREKANRLDKLHTIIFIRLRNSIGYEVSGYIDYAERLLNEDWTPYFKGEKKVKPHPTDLSYYHWKSGTTQSNVTRNFLTLTDVNKGCLFLNRLDRLTILVDPASPPGQNTTRARVYSDCYAQVELFDHVLRQKT